MKYLIMFVQVFALAAIVLLPQALHGSQDDPLAAYYPGDLGDRIDYRAGALTRTSTDVFIRGRRGMDVSVSRCYNSAMYASAVADSAYEHPELNTLVDSSLYQYFGPGWYLGVAYLTLGVENEQIVYQDGSKEEYFANRDTLSNSRFPFRLESGNLLTHFGLDSATADTLLTTEGTKLIFDHRAGGNKYLTKSINILGDTTTIDFHGSTNWLKKITEPTGRWVKFQYRNTQDSIDTDNAPIGDSIRLYRLRYQSHSNKPLHVTYHYDSLSSWRLMAVSYPSGQTEQYDYTNTVFYNPNPDWDTDTAYYDTDSSYDGDLYYLSEITSPAGTVVEYQYRTIRSPIYGECDLERHDGSVGQIDTRWNFRVNVGVSKRISEGDTLKLEYQMLKHYLGHNGALHGDVPVGMKTTVRQVGGGIDELFFHYETECETNPRLLACLQRYNIMWPGRLFQWQSIYDSDTSCTVFSYGDDLLPTTHNDTFDTIGVFTDTSWMYGEIVDVYAEKWVFRPKVIQIWSGVRYFRPDMALVDLDSVFLATSQSKFTGNRRISAPGGSPITINSEGGENDSTRARGSFSSFIYTLWWGPYGSMSYTQDTVLAWTYVAEHNLSLVTKRKTLREHHDTTAISYEEIAYDSDRFYRPSTISTYLDPTWHTETDTLVSSYVYDDAGMKTAVINPFGDTTFYSYDETTYQLEKTWRGSELRDSTKYEYYTDGALLRKIDRFGLETNYRLDSIGRDSTFRLPMEADSISHITELFADSGLIVTSVKVDDSQSQVVRAYSDNHRRKVKKISPTSASPDQYIVDSIVYNSLGRVTAQMRARYDTDSVSDTVWTEYSYDQSGRRVNTTYADGTADSVFYIDEFNREYVYQRGNRRREVYDFDGNIIKKVVFDADSTVIDSSMYEYGMGNRLVKETDYEGRSREYEYDDFGRLTKMTDPDVGTTQTWYSKTGLSRFVRHNSETDYSYFKYDSDYRMIETGTVASPDLDSVDFADYPTSDTTISVKFRYDDYPSAADSADMANGLGYCAGRLTKVEDESGHTLFYYDGRGRVGIKAAYIEGIGTQKIEYEYYANNKIKSIKYPNDNEATYDLDLAGRVEAIQHTWACEDDTTMETIVDNIEYEAWGPATAWEFKNGLKSRRKYDQMSRLEMTRNYDDTYNYYSRQFTFSDGFMAAEIMMDTAGSDSTSLGTIRQFDYDDLGRLTSAILLDPNATSAPPCSLAYGYDDNNNLTHKWLSTLTDTMFYSHFDGTNADSAVWFGEDSVWFLERDERGRVVNKTSSVPSLDSTLWKSQQLYSYDFRSLLTHVRDTSYDFQEDTSRSYTQNFAEFTYNHKGQRVKAVLTEVEWTWMFSLPSSDWQPDSTITTNYYVWSGGRVVYEKLGSTEPRNHVYGLGQKLASAYWDRDDGWGGDMMMMMMGGGIPGDTTGIGDPPGGGGGGGEDSCYTTMTYYVNDKHGSVRAGVGETAPITRLIEYYPYGDILSVFGGGSVYGFIGKEDPGIGLLDFGPRYYNSTMGRFMSPDPILAGPSAYSYAEGNPVMLYDPTGMQAVIDEDERAYQRANWMLLYGPKPPRPLSPSDMSDDYRLARDLATFDSHNKFSSNGNPADAPEEQTYVGEKKKKLTVKLFFWGVEEDEDGNLSYEGSRIKDTFAGHMSLAVFEEGNPEPIAYISLFPDADGDGLGDMHSFGQDEKAYDNAYVVDITDQFDTGQDIEELKEDMNVYAQKWEREDNCGDAISNVLTNSNYKGTLPAKGWVGVRLFGSMVPSIKAHVGIPWVEHYKKSGYPMEKFTKDGDGKWPSGFPLQH